MDDPCSPSNAVCTPSGVGESALTEVLDVELFRALCDPTRITLVCRLATASRPLTVTEVSDCCGVHLSGVSRHLATLRNAGVISAEKHGREVRYRLESEHLTTTLRRAAAAVEACCAGCCSKENDDARQHDKLDPR